MARQYLRSSNGKFSGAQTVQQNKTRHDAIRRADHKELNISAGSKRKRKLKSATKLKGRVVRTKQAKAAANRKRFG